MTRNIELLAPGGDIDSIKAAIAAGADAIYCGINRFNARNRAENIVFDDLNGIISLAHRNNCKIFLTLNIIIVESEIPALLELLNKLTNTKIDGIIVQDLGLLHIVSKYFPSLEIHGSTQLTTHNKGQIKFLKKLAVSRVNLSRELSINEIRSLTLFGHENGISTEVFVHGSYCISFSGLCYISSVLGGRSGNRGRCSQPCRDQYETTPEGNMFPLNLKDNSAYFDLQELYEAGVDSVKIEGRIKKFDYVYTVVNCWKNRIRSFFDKNIPNDGNSDLFKVFNRDFSNSFLQGDISKKMFIDNPRDNSIKKLSSITDNCTNKELIEEKQAYYAGKGEIVTRVKSEIEGLSTGKQPMTLAVHGQKGSVLKVSVQTPETSFSVTSDIVLVQAGPGSDNECKKKNNCSGLNYLLLFDRLKSLNSTEFYIEDLNLDNLGGDLFLPFKELTSIKKQIFFNLNGAREFIDPISILPLKNQTPLETKPVLSVLISSAKDLHLCNHTSADIFFQLPNSFKDKFAQFKDLFLTNKDLTPWFPSILIGEDYARAIELLQHVQPSRIVTNNSGVAYEAWQRGIPWIAGPHFNIVNSFSLLCLQENFNCQGSFISNEISKKQIKAIKRPDDFQLYYSIYHPISLITSRQCLFHQVIGCEKDGIDDECILQCKKHSTITNLHERQLFIEKTEGNYHNIYNNKKFLNTDIISDIADVFASFCIDLRDVKTQTQCELDKSRVVQLFDNLVNGMEDSETEIKQNIKPSTQSQYIRIRGQNSF